jgi:hypothetical protein
LSSLAPRRWPVVSVKPIAKQAIDALQTAEATCRNQNGNGAAPSIVGTPAFDACMQGQGYRRAQ